MQRGKGVSRYDVHEFVSELQTMQGHARFYTDKWAVLVGVAIGDVWKQNHEAVAAVAGSTAVLTDDQKGYKLTWGKSGNRLTLNHHGRWKWETMMAGGAEVVLRRRGAIRPLHDVRWIAIMRERGHDRHYARSAVKYFAKLMPAQPVAQQIAA